MRMLSKAAVLAVAVSVVSVIAQGQMQPRKGETKIYANEIREAYESPVATVGPNDILTVESTKGNMCKVRTASGDVGFVAKSDLTKLSAANKSRAFQFEAANIEAYMDTPTPVYILDTDGSEADPISLDRSFKSALRENIDKETLDRL